MPALDKHKLYYEDLPFTIKNNKNRSSGGKGKKMPKKEVTEKVPKVRKKYAPTRLEVFKTVTIAVLITAIIAFIAGMRFADNQQVTVMNAVDALTATKQADAAPVKK